MSHQVLCVVYITGVSVNIPLYIFFNVQCSIV